MNLGESFVKKKCSEGREVGILPLYLKGFLIRAQKKWPKTSAILLGARRAQVQKDGGVWETFIAAAMDPSCISLALENFY